MRAQARHVTALVSLVLMAVLSVEAAGAAPDQQGDVWDEIPVAQTPDDPSPRPEDPAILPRELDPAPYDAFLAGLMPASTDAPRLVAEVVGGLGEDTTCALSATAPRTDGIMVVATADFSCTANQSLPAVRVCIDKQALGQWYEKGCFTKAATRGSALTTEAVAICDHGSWNYRARAIAISRSAGSVPPETVLYPPAWSQEVPIGCWFAE